MEIATRESYVLRIIDGCEYLWTDFGFPMCRKGGSCKLFQMVGGLPNPNYGCPIQKTRIDIDGDVNVNELVE